MVNITTTSDAVSTGTREVAEVVGGGILPGSLVVINGESRTGKSVFCQHLAYNALISRESSVAYYTTYPNHNDLINQMDYFSLNIQHHFVTDKLRVCPLNQFIIHDNPVKENPEKSILSLLDSFSELPPRFSLLIVDTLTKFIIKLLPKVKIEVFKAFRQMCHNGRSVILVTDNYSFEKEILTRIYLMSDYYIRMKTDEMKFQASEVDDRDIKILEVRKLRGAEMSAAEAIKFEIKPETGFQVLPFVKIKV